MSAPYPLPCVVSGKGWSWWGGGRFPKVKTSVVALGQMEVWGLEYQSYKDFWSQGGREVIKVTHQQALGGFGGIESPL